MITLDQLNACIPYAGDRAPIFLECLNTTFSEFDISNLNRRAAFLAQIAHESGSLRYTRELADGSAYEYRKDLGNIHEGDGKRFLGRGLIQVTGRTNTLACLAALGRKPDDLAYLETPMGASRSAGWFWKSRDINRLADQGLFWTISKVINGGTNGLDDRIKHYTRCRKVFGI